MAKILGKAGRFTSDEAARLRARRLVIAFVMVGVLGVTEGVTLSHLWSKMNPPEWLTPLVQMGGVFAIGVMVRWGFRKLDELEAERLNWQRGDDGETVVGRILAGFPDEYCVINDLKVPGQQSNLDHVVVGPTGVFVLDAKNWRGVVRADGKGELLLNDKRLDKNYIGQYVGRIMGVKEKICAQVATTGYFQGLFVFTAARVEASWGKTGYVHCLREDQLWDYIVEKQCERRMKPPEVEGIAWAFERLARMDPDFTDRETLALGHKPVAVEDAEPMLLANNQRSAAAAPTLGM